MPQRRPNVLLITADDMNWNATGAFGADTPGYVPGVTPHIDRLAGEGLVLHRAHVTVAICQPSRQAMMTGRYPHNSRALGFDPIDPSVPTLQERLHDAGYLNSTRTPWLVRWPGVVGAGRTNTTDFVGGIDFAPTIAEVCGLDPLTDIDGRSFAGLLRDGAPHRDHLVTHINTIASGRSYPMRAVHTDRFGYIFSAWSDGRTEYRNESMHGLTWNAMTAASGGDSAVAARCEMFTRRVPEELYDFDADSDALRNLIDDPACAEAKGELRRLLRAEMQRSSDPCLAAFEAHASADDGRFGSGDPARGSVPPGAAGCGSPLGAAAVPKD